MMRDLNVSRLWTAFACAVCLGPVCAQTSAPQLSTTVPRPTDGPADPYLWLEDISGEKSLSWVRAQNERTFQRLKALPFYQGLYHDALAVLDSESRIPEIAQE